MDKSWMSMDRRSKTYEDGVENFLKLALVHSNDPDYIRCPCLNCGLAKFFPIREIRNHLICMGIDQTYIIWYWHGEILPADGSDSPKAKRGKFCDDSFVDNTVEMVEAAHAEFDSNPGKFEKLLEDAHKPAYPGCVKFSKLSALVRLYNLKALGGWSNRSFSLLLAFLSDFLPVNHEMPPSLYEAKKTLCALGMEYEKIHACPNDCILYRKEHSDAISCPTCGLSRWKVDNKEREHKKANVPAKVLWYFPQIPRFRRMFRNKKTAENLLWHAKGREEDGKLRHPADSPSWKLVDHKWPEFGDEPRNLRLTIAADGINPYSSLSSRYSCWPVIMVTYNLPPWLCMKRKFMMLTMLIPGPKQPGNDIDVYLAPLVDDLKTLWEVRIEAYDAFAEEIFMLKAVLLWTINDFPAYGNLCGCRVKGYKACAICGEKTGGIWLQHGKKVSFSRSRRWLPKGHELRYQAEEFYSEVEHELAPIPLSGEEILEVVERITPSWGKKIPLKRKTVKVELRFGKKKRRDASKIQKKKKTVKPPKEIDGCWKKKSIFFGLPYWRSMYVRHCLDVMHIEKNNCESLFGTLLDIPGKTKDGVASRKDLVEKGVRPDLAPLEGAKKSFLPPAAYSLSKEEKHSVCELLSTAKFPSDYGSNFKNLVSMSDLKLYGLKSHDCHLLMQQLLPVAICAVLPKHVRGTIIRFCRFFSALCSKVVDVPKLAQMEEEIVMTLCLLEKIFPRSFFDIMVHLTVHLIREVRLCGPVYLRWMYPFERYMKFLKDYVRNRKSPEGCMAECYIVEEAIEFCADYLSDFQSIGLPLETRGESVVVDKPLGAGNFAKVDAKLLRQAHLCVLENTEEVMPYINEHIEELKTHNPKKSKGEKWLRDEHNRTFIDWFKENVENQLVNPDNDISETVEWMAHGPRSDVRKFSGYLVNRCEYHTKLHDDEHYHQNSGVSLVAKTMQVSSSKDKNPRETDLTFYGVIQEIWELNYNSFTHLIFKCDWVRNTTAGIKVDDEGFVLVNLGALGHKADTFVIATHVQKVFYIKDTSQPNWSVVLTTPNMDWLQEDELFSTSDRENQGFTAACPSVEPFERTIDDELVYVRSDCEGTWVENVVP